MPRKVKPIRIKGERIEYLPSPVFRLKIYFPEKKVLDKCKKFGEIVKEKKEKFVELYCERIQLFYPAKKVSFWRRLFGRI